MRRWLYEDHRPGSAPRRPAPEPGKHRPRGAHRGRGPHHPPALDWADPAPTREAIRKPSSGTGTCHGALLVATGQLDAFLLLGAGRWDVAPLVPIIEEAGGSYDDLTIDPSSGTVSALFTNHALRHQIINAMNHRPDNCS